MNKNQILNDIKNLIKSGSDRDSLIKDIKTSFPKTRGRKRLNLDNLGINTAIRLPKNVRDALVAEARSRGISLSKLIREKVSI